MKVEMHATLTLAHPHPGQDASALGDRLIEEMHALEGTGGHDFCSVGYSVISGERLEVDVDLGVSRPDNDQLQAATDALCWIRAALHAAGVGTPEWPTVETIKFDGMQILADA
ncbi:hypothetical protein Ga0074812_15111 [Parafrankia irregularis]|uniref:Uncharacterized protein n=1 Tax=Parafrankia irregularis TaxID=795642 RepID=A0A0S4R235_9ACTN|nr:MULTISPECIES: hypothetical protein [Parafrankia]MBE3203507.1 hypothetical protein [Parafrankia sp. CH37]CUU60950.1 hypothetical protein Ga0074812_15111 [Parafrankia irregularis]